jgi:secretion/DNA translocation related TadE-like protein
MSTREDGMGTLLVLAVAGLVVTAAVVAIGVTQVIAARHQAAAAADLGALAGAAAVAGDPCAAAAQVVRANAALLVACRVEAPDVVVTARATTPSWLGLRWRPEVSARAGPAQR